ncbi:hypothetical protein LAK86_07910 [Microbacterium sp. cx-55]|nr:hypothetical protein [Microbacterium sp. cx-55]
MADGVNQRGISLAYGDKQTLNGIDFVPVAFVTYGFGGIQDSPQFGDGGGGGGVAIPLGAYIGGTDGIRFRANTVAVLAVSICAISTLGLAIKWVVKVAR